MTTFVELAQLKVSRFNKTSTKLSSLNYFISTCLSWLTRSQRRAIWPLQRGCALTCTTHAQGLLIGKLTKFERVRAFNDIDAKPYVRTNTMINMLVRASVCSYPWHANYLVLRCYSQLIPALWQGRSSARIQAQHWQAPGSFSLRDCGKAFARLHHLSRWVPCLFQSYPVVVPNFDTCLARLSVRVKLFSTSPSSSVSDGVSSL